jgi:hypothetical protein
LFKIRRVVQAEAKVLRLYFLNYKTQKSNFYFFFNPEQEKKHVEKSANNLQNAIG